MTAHFSFHGNNYEFFSIKETRRIFLSFLFGPSEGLNLEVEKKCPPKLTKQTEFTHLMFLFHILCGKVGI